MPPKIQSNANRPTALNVTAKRDGLLVTLSVQCQDEENARAIYDHFVSQAKRGHIRFELSTKPFN